jgi:hypothetical protein
MADDPTTKKTEAAAPRNRIEFRYRVSPTYTIHAISGAHGGVTPRGEVFMNLFHESRAMPEKTTHKMNPDGTLGEIIEQEQPGGFTRNVLFGVSMAPETARQIAKWLNQKVDEYERMAASGKPSGDLVH